MRLNYKQIFLIGFGFLASSAAWAVYNNYVPLILEKYLASTLLIGIVMTIDNVFGVVFQPLFGHMSDTSKSRIGRRMSFILFGMPICVLMLILIPLMPGLVTIMLAVIIFNFIMSVWRAPVIALMPDFTPSPLRSKANGIVNLMGGVGTLAVFGLGGVLYNRFGMEWPFVFAAAIMIVAVIVMKATIKEPPAPLYREGEEEKKPLRFRDLPGEQRRFILKSLLFVLLAILFWFIAYSAVETFFSLYATNTLQGAGGQYLTGGDASIMLGAFSLMFMIFALPAGILGTKIGRKRTIMMGLCGIVALFAIMYFNTSIPVTWVLLILGGVCWALININSYPMVVDMGTPETTGLYTGFYYIASFSASVVSPILFGLIRDAVGNYQVLFAYAAIAFAVALVMMLFVKRGEAQKPLSEAR